MTVEILFNGKKVDFVFVEWVGATFNEFEHSEGCSNMGDDFHEELYCGESGDIIDMFTGITKLIYEVKDGFFKYEVLNETGEIVRMFMIPSKYLRSIDAGKKLDYAKPKTPMNKLSTGEKRKAR